MSVLENGRDWPANARLCHMERRDDFDGYGFNLHAEKGRPGQYVGKVDQGSPAEAAGLRPGDRILAVNGAGISGETHAQVVQRIRALEAEAKLLVVDPKDEPDGKEEEAGVVVPPQPARLDLHLTVAEIRAQLAARRKYDPKKETIDIRKKYDIVQKL